MTVVGSYKGKKFIFVHIPKNGGCSVAQIIMPYVWSPKLSNVYDSLHDLLPKYIRSSIRYLLSAKGNPKTFLAREYLRKFKGIKSHMRAKEIKDFLGKELYNKSFVFAVARNPYTREVSRFKFVRNNKKHRCNKLFSNFKDFNDFVDFRYEKYKQGENITQKSFLIDNKGNQIIDQYIKLENINKEFEEMIQKLGLPNNIELPHINKTRGKTNWSDYYSKESLKKIREVCSEDFEFFNYDKSF
tara:strand:+ start:1321 stop:2049 length:729 start_codon:yes stop_codon:yes gene_type:complete